MAMFSWAPGSVFFIFIFQLVTSNAQDIIYNLDEEEPADFVVGNLINDLQLEVSSTAVFSILGDDPVPFTINSASDLQTTEVIDREVGVCSDNLLNNCQYNLRILISDIGIKRVTINLNDINDNEPIFPKTNYPLEVSESVAVGTTIPMESAVDADVGVNGIDNYRLDNTFNDMFGVVVTDTVDGAKTVHLEIKRPLDRETRDQYTLVLRASDNGDPQREGIATVNLIITDSNDNSPEFTQDEYSKSVSEDVPIGYEILNLHAEDTDLGANAQIEYTFGNSVTDIVRQHFEVDPVDGVLRTIADLDHERNELFVMIIQAKDKGQNSIPGFTTVTINVTDVNDNSPKLEISYSSDIDREGNTIFIPESIDEGYFIGLLLASDADSGKNGDFVVSFDGTHGHFNLIEESDVLNEFYFTTVSGIDREKLAEYNLTIVAQDNGNEESKRSVLQVRIIVTDVNDNTPYFTSPVNKFVMPEHNDYGYAVDTVIAIDNDIDLNGDIIYSLEEADGFFQIDPSSGQITAISSIDRESSASVSFYVSACDKGTPQRCNTTSVIVEILDKNDKTPYFLESRYEFDIEENKAVETLIGQVTATDEDVGVNGQLSYSLSEQSDNFFVISATGEIYSKRPFDHEKKKNYRLTVVVNDLGLPAKYNDVTVDIVIKDINDNAPFIVFPTPVNDTFFIPATAQSEFWIADVIAFDIDDGRNGLIEYSIKDGNGNDAFQILSNGTVMTKRSLMKDWEGVYDLKINVTDKALQKRSNVTNLTIVIANKNFNEPLRESAFYERFNLSVQHYRNISPNDEASWPYIVVIALGAVAFILFIIFCVLLARCHKKDRMEHTYKVPKEEELFQAGKVSVDGKKDPNSQLVSPAHETNGTPASYAQSKNIIKWKMQSPDARLGNKQMMTFSSNSDLNTGSNPSLASTRNTHEADAEVQRLLYKLKVNDTDSVSSNSEMDPSSDSGHGDSEHDVYGRHHELGRNHPRNALKNRNTYMASPHCTPDCKILGHSDLCWMPDPHQDPILLTKQRQNAANYHSGNYGPKQIPNTNGYLSTFDPGENVRMAASCPQIAIAVGLAAVSGSRTIEDPDLGRVISPGTQPLTPIREDPHENSDLDLKNSGTIDGKVTFHRERGNHAPASKNYDNFTGRSNSCSVLPQSSASLGLIRNDSGVIITSRGNSSDNLACSALNSDPDDLCSYSTVPGRGHRDPTYDPDKLTPTTEKLFFSEWV